MGSRRLTVQTKTRIIANNTNTDKANSFSQRSGIECASLARSPTENILLLQRNAGNQAIQQMMKSGEIQAKLKIGAPNDKYELEADRVADEVLRVPQTVLSTSLASDCRLGKESVMCNKDYNTLQNGPVLRRKSMGHISSAANHTSVLSLRRWLKGGRPLSVADRAFFEPRFGFDLSGVRIHTNDRAAYLANVLNASAFTLGSDIVFGAGSYAPGSTSGRWLMAHEFTHVVQQGKESQPRIQRFLQDCSQLLSEPVTATLIAGQTVHNLIEADFLARVPGALRVMIPGASAGALRSQGLCGEDTTVIPPQLTGGLAGAGYPDLARLTPGGILQVAEIKPAAVPCLVDGEEQLLRYINQGNARDPQQTAWRTSMGVTVVAPVLPSAYPPPALVAPGVRIVAAWCNPGLMIYTVQPLPERRRHRVRAAERSRAREELRRSAGQQAATAVATTVVVVAGAALWRHFWRAVIRRFAIRGLVAAGLSAADGPLPFGELVSLGLAVATIIEIAVVWDELWREADRIAAQEA